MRIVHRSQKVTMTRGTKCIQTRRYAPAFKTMWKRESKTSQLTPPETQTPKDED